MPKLPFGFDRPEDSPGFLLWQTTVLWQRQVKKVLEAYEISHAQFVILATLMWLEAHQGEITQIQIVNLTKLDKMTVSKSLRKLSALGYVKRVENAQDTRAKTVSLTLRGKEFANLLVPLVERVDRRFFGSLSSSDHQRLISLLRQLTIERPE